MRWHEDMPSCLTGTARQWLHHNRHNPCMDTCSIPISHVDSCQILAATTPSLHPDHQDQRILGCNQQWGCIKPLVSPASMCITFTSVGFQVVACPGTALPPHCYPTARHLIQPAIQGDPDLLLVAVSRHILCGWHLLPFPLSWQQNVSYKHTRPNVTS